MAGTHLMAFETGVARALSAVGASGDDPALDPLADPAGAARALAEALDAPEAPPILLRAAPELGAAGRERVAASPGDGPVYAPTPRDPVWVRFRPGSSALRLAPLRLPEGGGAAATASPSVDAAAMEVTSALRPCCDAPGCARERTHVAAWLELAGAAEPAFGRRLLVAEAQDINADRAEAVVEAVAAPLARALAVPLRTPRGAEPAGAIAPRPVPSGPASPPLAASALAGLALRSEGDMLVLRDHASVGPRGTARRNALLGVALLFAAVALWAQTAVRASAGDTGVAVGLGSAAALLSLAGYAFLGVARFSRRYVARSSPLVWLARDRFVVAPWVSRTGAIDVRPEGRLGAAIAVGELRGVHVRERDDRFAVELDTDHGPIDALRTDREDVARHARDAIERAAASVRHPGGPSAKQRLRARAQAPAPAG